MSAVDRGEVLAEERRIMNQYAPLYDEAGNANSYVYRLERAEWAAWVARTVREAGRNPGELAVLDAGCATGGTLRMLEGEGFNDLTGLDMAEEMLAEAVRRGPRDARWIRGTLEDAPLAPSSFDVIVACFTIHHLHDPATFFELVDDVLRPGGWFFALEYDGGTSVSDATRTDSKRHLGDLARKAFAFKNRRGLASVPFFEPEFNPAHKLLSYPEIESLVPDPERYELWRVNRGPLRPTLLPVLVEQSPLDRAIARTTGVLDGWVAGRVPGLFHWVAGRRVA